MMLFLNSTFFDTDYLRKCVELSLKFVYVIVYVIIYIYILCNV